MFKYPLVVTIDTNIFDAAKYNLSDASTLRILENHVKSGKIKVVLSDIVVQESKRHIAARVKEVCGIVNIARNSALKVYNEHLISSIGMNEMFRIVESEDDIIAKEEKVFDDFLCAIDAEILGTDLIDINSVLSDYFGAKPPFEESGKKKSEFPDAFIAQQIRNRFGETETVVIVSNDKGFIRACRESENHLFFNSLGALYNAISKEDAAYVYDWEWDRINWEIVFSTDHAFAIDDIISFSCHEVEPGHLTFIGLRTKAAYENGCPELAVIAQFNESSAFIEGAARMSIDLCLPGEELFAFERDLLFPLAGIDKGLAECLPVWHKFRKATNFAKLVLERNRWDGKWSKEEGIAWMKQYMLAPPQDCAALVDHLAADPGHFVAHDYSREVITNYVYDKEPTWEGRWRLYRELSMAHISMRAIEDRSFQL